MDTSEWRSRFQDFNVNGYNFLFIFTKMFTDQNSSTNEIIFRYFAMFITVYNNLNNKFAYKIYSNNICLYQLKDG